MYHFSLTDVEFQHQWQQLELHQKLLFIHDKFREIVSKLRSVVVLFHRNVRDVHSILPRRLQPIRPFIHTTIHN